MDQNGWIALRNRELNLTGYRISRIAKFLADNRVHFTIGATILGKRTSLNTTIREIINSETDVIEGATTSGSTDREKAYPGFDLECISKDSMSRMILKIQGAILHARTQTILRAL